MFELVAPYKPAGDQPQAIAKLTDGLLSGARHQVFLGVTALDASPWLQTARK
jgi:excinuclease ABC subunit B